jgi:hypothetical protein
LVLLEGLFGAGPILPRACVPGTKGKNLPLPLKILLFIKINIILIPTSFNSERAWKTVSIVKNGIGLEASSLYSQRHESISKKPKRIFVS